MIYLFEDYKITGECSGFFKRCDISLYIRLNKISFIHTFTVCCINHLVFAFHFVLSGLYPIVHLLITDVLGAY